MSPFDKLRVTSIVLRDNHHILVDLELDEAAHYFGCKLAERNIDRHHN